MTSGADPFETALGILRAAGSALTADELRQALVQAGVADAVRPGVLRRLRQHAGVRVEGGRSRPTYRLVDPTPALPVVTAAVVTEAVVTEAAAGEVTAAQALDLLLRGGLADEARAAYAELVRAAVGAAAAAQAAAPAEAGRRRQARVDGLRALAELASEVEELVANEASGTVIVQRVRGWVRRSGLEPVDRAGESVVFDRARHQPIGGAIAPGAPVVVVRPGYVWRSADGDVALSRPVVER